MLFDCCSYSKLNSTQLNPLGQTKLTRLYSDSPMSGYTIAPLWQIEIKLTQCCQVAGWRKKETNEERGNKGSNERVSETASAALTLTNLSRPFTHQKNKVQKIEPVQQASSGTAIHALQFSLA